MENNNETWSREQIFTHVQKALAKSGFIRVPSKNNGNNNLNIDSFGWYQFWIYLERELGKAMIFDPKDGGLTTMTTCTPNMITDFVYKNMNDQENGRLPVQQRGLLRVFSQLPFVKTM